VPNKLKSTIADICTGYGSAYFTDELNYNAQTISDAFRSILETELKEVANRLDNFIKFVSLTKPAVPLDIQLVQMVVFTLICLTSIVSSAILIQHITLYWLKKGRRMECPKNYCGELDRPPIVSICIPIRNEEISMIKRILSTIGAQRYPKSSMEVIVISDDSPEKAEEIRKTCQKASKKFGLNIQVIERKIQHGHKAGALNDALLISKGEYVAVFDVDSILDPLFIFKTVNFLSSHDEYDVAVGRWTPINRNSPVACAQGEGMEFLTEVLYKRKFALGFPIVILGSGSVFRRSFLKEMGGWNEEILAEDVELWVRAVLKGKKTAYIDDLRVGVEVPETYAIFKRQHSRWMYGTTQVLKKYFVKILRADIPWLLKLDIFSYLLHYYVFLTNILLMGLSLISIVFGLDLLIVNEYPSLWILALTGLYSFTYFDFLRNNGRTLKDCLVISARSAVIASALLPTTAIKIVKSLIGLNETWHVTPKGSRIRMSSRTVILEWIVGWSGVSLGIYALEKSLFATSSFLIAMSIPGIYVGIRTARGLW